MKNPATTPSFSSIGLCSDHVGFLLKNQLIDFLKKNRVETLDFGCTDPNGSKVDYPDYCIPLAQWVKKQDGRGGIAICGSGIGMEICANKFKGIRAAAVYSPELAKLSRQHNDCNILCLGARFTKENEAAQILEMWRSTAFDGGRHFERIKKILAIEK